jgi:hypothetical protein
MRFRVDRHGRVTPEAVDLFRIAMCLQHEGLPTDSEEYRHVSLALHKALGLRAFDVNVLNVQISDLPDPSLDPIDRNSVMRAVSLRRELVLANH